MAARSKAWVCGRSLSGNASSNPTGDMMSVGSVLCCQIERSLHQTDRSLNRPPLYGVSEYDSEASIKKLAVAVP